MTEETKETIGKKILRIAGEMKMLAAGLLLLPLFGANIVSFVDWTGTLYNLNTELAKYATKTESTSVALDVLKFIEPALRNDITSLEMTIDMIVKDEATDEDEQILTDLRTQYKEKILELNRIRLRIKIYEPTWQSIDDMETK